LHLDIDVSESAAGLSSIEHWKVLKKQGQHFDTSRQNIKFDILILGIALAKGIPNVCAYDSIFGRLVDNFGLQLRVMQPEALLPKGDRQEELLFESPEKANRAPSDETPSRE